MRRTVRKRIRRQGGGVDLAIDLNIDVVTNVGGTRPHAEHDAGPAEPRPEREPEQQARTTDRPDPDGRSTA